MAQTKRSVSLDSRTKRLELPLEVRFTETLADGRYLIYRRPGNGTSGSWSARWRDPSTGAMPQTKIGVADDFTDADGVKVLTYKQACAMAGKWFTDRERMAHLRDTGEVVTDAPWTVRDAIALYIETAKEDGLYVATIEAYAKARILPTLGDMEVGKLSKARIEQWHKDLAKSARRKTGQGLSRERTEEELEEQGPMTDAQIRKRKSTANRILAILKRSLTISVEKGRFSGYTPWRDVRPFKAVTSSRVRFLSPEEQVRLVNACAPEDFRNLVIAALHTGSRFSPLARLEVRDFNPVAGTIWIEKDKGGKGRHVVLDSEAIEWFKGITAGRASSDLMLPRTHVRRVTRKDNPNQWKPSDTDSLLDKACAAAKLESLTFHELRHTYASMLANAGVPLAFISEQLGHSDTRMVEKHYGHLCQNAKSDAIRKMMPARGFGGDPNIETLAVQKRKA